MTYFDNGFARLYQADARHLPIPDSSVDCVVTSPPYWGLRDYGIGEWEGGDAECDHKDSNQTRGNIPGTKQATNNNGEGGASYRYLCGKCGATRVNEQLGLEPTPEAYCANMVEVFREVWRVLKPTGTVWLNLGDSYSSKDLVGIPWRVAFALQADGWYLRSDIIWSKPNPMPESVTDRPTKAHEYVFLLTKSLRYYYDADAIREPMSAASMIRNQSGWNGNQERDYVGGTQNHLSKYLGSDSAKEATHRNKRSVWEIATHPYPEAHFATYPEKLVEPCILAGCPQDGVVLDPFAGSGTTLAVAQRLGRKSIGADLSEEYLKLASKRLGAIPMPMILA
jgi:DNA modification methylase